MNNVELRSHLVDLIGKIPDEKLEHFAATIDKVGDCYQSQALHAVLIVHDDVDETQSVYTINSAEDQTTRMIGVLAEVFLRVPQGPNVYC
jgi:hypothetical protein